MHKILLISSIALSFSVSANQGSLSDQRSGLIFSYSDIASSQTQTDLTQCQQVANSSKKATEDKKGSGLKGAAKGAAAGAAVGAISGGSGSDGAKIGAAAGVVGGRLSGRKQEKEREAANEQAYETVMRNCMINKNYVALN
ncbi:glycine zipper domain-containing protein [uncultured Shewanella sp.]|uniref:glycine zipper domain-containing protein n=1 Tax=uncultured Shewanella sp. TaxID=173975 RepID=UPI0026367F0A|nr:glycine zipper domain-containing protein [uncultured Shewanella sp.]